MSGERYTAGRAVGECRWEIAARMCIAALMCMIMAGGGLPMPVNAVVTGLLGPVGTTAAVLDRVWRRNR